MPQIALQKSVTELTMLRRHLNDFIPHINHLLVQYQKSGNGNWGEIIEKEFSRLAGTVCTAYGVIFQKSVDTNPSMCREITALRHLADRFYFSSDTPKLINCYKSIAQEICTKLESQIDREHVLPLLAQQHAAFFKEKYKAKYKEKYEAKLNAAVSNQEEPKSQPKP